MEPPQVGATLVQEDRFSIGALHIRVQHLVEALQEPGQVPG